MLQHAAKDQATAALKTPPSQQLGDSAGEAHMSLAAGKTASQLATPTTARKQLVFSPPGSTAQSQGTPKQGAADADAGGTSRLPASAESSEAELTKIFDGNEAKFAAAASAQDDKPRLSPFKRSPKQKAALLGSTEQPTAFDSAFRTALNIGNMTAIKLIVNEEPQIVHEVFEAGNTVCHIAAANGYQSVLKFLLAAGANPSTKNEHGQTSLHVAVQNGHEHLVTFLVTEFGSPSLLVRDKAGANTLHYAVRYHQPQIAEFIVDSAALEPGHDHVLTALDTDGRSPLDLAEESKDRVATTLLKQAASWHKNLAAGKGFVSDFMASLQCAKNEKMKLGALTDEEVQTQRGENAERGYGALTHKQRGHIIKELRLRGCVRAARDYVAAGGDPNAVVDSLTKRTPLHMCARRGGNEAVLALIEAKADISKLCRWSWWSTGASTSALHLAVKSTSVPTVAALLERGADMNAVNKATGYAPIHQASAAGLDAVLSVLLRYGANVFELDHNGRNAIDIANKFHQQTCMKLLEAPAFEALLWSSDAEALYRVLASNARHLGHSPGSLDESQLRSVLTSFEVSLSSLCASLPKSVFICPVHDHATEFVRDALAAYEAWEETQRSSHGMPGESSMDFHTRAQRATDAIRGLLDASVTVMRALMEQLGPVEEQLHLPCYTDVMALHEREQGAIKRYMSDTEKYAIVQKVKSGAISVEEAASILDSAADEEVVVRKRKSRITNLMHSARQLVRSASAGSLHNPLALFSMQSQHHSSYNAPSTPPPTPHMGAHQRAASRLAFPALMSRLKRTKSSGAGEADADSCRTSLGAVKENQQEAQDGRAISVGRNKQVIEHDDVDNVVITWAKASLESVAKDGAGAAAPLESVAKDGAGAAAPLESVAKDGSGAAASLESIAKDGAGAAARKGKGATADVDEPVHDAASVQLGGGDSAAFVPAGGLLGVSHPNALPDAAEAQDTSQGSDDVALPDGWLATPVANEAGVGAVPSAGRARSLSSKQPTMAMNLDDLIAATRSYKEAPVGVSGTQAYAAGTGGARSAHAGVSKAVDDSTVSRTGAVAVASTPGQLDMGPYMDDYLSAFNDGSDTPAASVSWSHPTPGHQHEASTPAPAAFGEASALDAVDNDTLAIAAAEFASAKLAERMITEAIDIEMSNLPAYLSVAPDTTDALLDEVLECAVADGAAGVPAHGELAWTDAGAVAESVGKAADMPIGRAAEPENALPSSSSGILGVAADGTDGVDLAHVHTEQGAAEIAEAAQQDFVQVEAAHQHATGTVEAVAVAVADSSLEIEALNVALAAAGIAQEAGDGSGAVVVDDGAGAIAGFESEPFAEAGVVTTAGCANAQSTTATAAADDAAAAASGAAQAEIADVDARLQVVQANVADAPVVAAVKLSALAGGKYSKQGPAPATIENAVVEELASSLEAIDADADADADANDHSGSHAAQAEVAATEVAAAYVVATAPAATDTQGAELPAPVAAEPRAADSDVQVVPRPATAPAATDTQGAELPAPVAAKPRAADSDVQVVPRPPTAKPEALAPLQPYAPLHAPGWTEDSLTRSAVAADNLDANTAIVDMDSGAILQLGDGLIDISLNDRDASMPEAAAAAADGDAWFTSKSAPVSQPTSDDSRPPSRQSSLDDFASQAALSSPVAAAALSGEPKAKKDKSKKKDKAARRKRREEKRARIASIEALVGDPASTRSESKGTAERRANAQATTPALATGDPANGSAATLATTAGTARAVATTGTPMAPVAVATNPTAPAPADDTVFENSSGFRAEHSRQRANSLPSQPPPPPPLATKAEPKRGSLFFGKAAFGLKKLKSKAKHKAKVATQAAFSNLAKEGLIAVRVSANDLPCQTKHLVREVGVGLGITIHVSKGKVGTRVIEVDHGGVADRAGLTRGHVICRIGGKDVLNVSYEKVIAALKQQTGAQITVDVVEDAVLQAALAQRKAAATDPLKGAPAWWREEQQKKQQQQHVAAHKPTQQLKPTPASADSRPRSKSATVQLPSYKPAQQLLAKAPAAPTLRCIHNVTDEDTLFKLSVKYGISVARLRTYNKMFPNDRLFPGKQLKIPDR